MTLYSIEGGVYCKSALRVDDPGFIVGGTTNLRFGIHAKLFFHPRDIDFTRLGKGVQQRPCD